MDIIFLMFKQMNQPSVLDLYKTPLLSNCEITKYNMYINTLNEAFFITVFEIIRLLFLTEKKIIHLKSAILQLKQTGCPMAFKTSAENTA